MTTDTQEPGLDLVKTYDAQGVVDYIVCPALSFINMHSESVPARQQVKTRLPKAFNEISITMLGGTRPKEPKVLVDHIIEKVFDDIEYNKKPKDMDAIHSMFMNYINMMAERELAVDSLSKPVEIAYMGSIIKSQVDCVVKDLTTERKYPAVVDFSNTRYENHYNPIVYRCQIIADYMELTHTNTEVMVLSLCSGKTWFYGKKTYGNLVHVAIEEVVQAMNAELFPVRYGWWCAGCYWRGICHRMFDVKLGE